MANAALPGHTSSSADGGLSGTPVVNMADLHRRVERLLANRENSSLNANSVSIQTAETEAIYANLVTPSNLLSCMGFDQPGITFCCLFLIHYHDVFGCYLGSTVGFESSSADLLFNAPSFKHRLPSERSNESGVLSALSPIPEAQGLTTMTAESEATEVSGTVSASASCESITGDSEVFDASSRRTSSSNLSHLEVAQVKVGLK